MIPKPTDWIILAMIENGDKYLKLEEESENKFLTEERIIIPNIIFVSSFALLRLKGLNLPKILH